MKKRLCLFIVLLLILTGCSKSSEPNSTSITTAEQSASEEVTTEASYDQLMNAAIVDYPEEAFGSIIGLVTGDVNGVFTVSCDINNAGKMAVVAENICKSSLEIGKDFDKYDILISYQDNSGWICTWHSYDCKTGILINTLTNYTEENVTIDRLYEWNNGEAQ